MMSNQRKTDVSNIWMLTERDICQDVHPHLIHRTNHSSSPADVDLMVGGNYVHSEGKLCKEDQPDILRCLSNRNRTWRWLSAPFRRFLTAGWHFFIAVFKASELLPRLNSNCARRWCCSAATRCDVWCFNKIKGAFKQMMLILSGQSLFVSAAALCWNQSLGAWTLTLARLKGLKISECLKKSVELIQYEVSKVEQSLLILVLPFSSWFRLPSLRWKASPALRPLSSYPLSPHPLVSLFASCSYIHQNHLHLSQS